MSENCSSKSWRRRPDVLVGLTDMRRIACRQWGATADGCAAESLDQSLLQGMKGNAKDNRDGEADGWVSIR